MKEEGEVEEKVEEKEKIEVEPVVAPVLNQIPPDEIEIEMKP